MAIVSKTRTYTTGDSLTASNYNDDRDEIIAGVNSITNAQIANGAAIELAKISGTGVDLATAQTLTNKTISAASNTLTGVTTLTGTETLTNKTLTAPNINMGSDATGDMYYRNGSSQFTRLPIGTSNQVLTVSGGLPVWSAANAISASGSISPSGNTNFTTQVDVNGATTTFSVSGTKTVFLVVSFDFQASVANDLLLGYINVDGVNLANPTVFQSSSSANRLSVGNNYIFSLANGSHTIKLRVERSSGSGTGTCLATTTFSYLVF